MNSVLTKIQRRLRNKPADWVFSAKDFLDLGSRAAVDQVLSRLAKAGTIRRVARGLYDRPRQSALLKTTAPATLDAVVSAVARRDAAVVVPDGAVDANQLGLTTAVPARPLYQTTGASRVMHVGQRTVQLKRMPRWLHFWADRQGAPVVNALRWLGPTLANDAGLAAKLRLRLPPDVAKDLQRNIAHLPAWMHKLVRALAQSAAHA